MIRFFRYWKGYLKIKVWGFAPERMINLCSKRNIMLWNIVKEQDYYTMYISIRGFYMLKEITRKTKTRVAILQRYGLPFFMKKFRKRTFFLLGALLSFFLWLFSSTLIWNIEVEGNQSITKQEITKLLKEEGVVITTGKNKIDGELLEKRIREKFEEVTWVCVKVEGTDLIVSMKENEVMQNKLQNEFGLTDSRKNEHYKDLVADKNGIVKSIMVKKGVALIKPKDMVEPGTILVTGMVPVYDEDLTVKKYLYTDAQADIIVNREIHYCDKISVTYLKKIYTGRKKKVTVIHCGTKEISLGNHEHFRYYDTIMENKELTIWKGVNLPIRIRTYEEREYYNQECVYQREQVEEIFLENYAAYKNSLEKEENKIIAESVILNSKDDFWQYEGKIETEEKIGIQIEH